MPFVEAIPRATKRSKPTISLACRRSSCGRVRWLIAISRALREKLGWQGRAFRQFINMERGEVVLTPSDEAHNAYSMSMNNGAFQATLCLPLISDRTVGATFLPFEIRPGGELLLKLPTWAGGKVDVAPQAMRRSRGVHAGKPNALLTPVIETGKALSPEAQAEKEDLREAALMLSRGATNITVMEHFGWPREKVDHLRRSLAAIKRAA